MKDIFKSQNVRNALIAFCVIAAVVERDAWPLWAAVAVAIFW